MQVVVEADTERIDAVVAKHAGLGDLVRNGWIVLLALDPHGSALRRRTASGWVSEAG